MVMEIIKFQVINVVVEEDMYKYQMIPLHQA